MNDIYKNCKESIAFIQEYIENFVGLSQGETRNKATEREENVRLQNVLRA
jgi:hypothetical protein